MERGTEMHHRLPKILRAGLAPAMTHNNVVSATIISDRIGIIDRNIVGALIELTHGIAACVHDFGDQSVRFVHCTLRIVDKLLLNEGPLLSISFSLGRRQAAEFKMA